MALLRRKSDRPFRGNHGDAGDEENSRLVTHRVTIGLSRAEKLAAMLASSRASKTIEVADVLGGMYLYDWERLSKFWNESSHDAAERLLRRVCQISPQRWHYWMELYDSQKRSGGRLSSWRALQRLAMSGKKEPATEKPLPKSPALHAVY